MNAQEPSDGWKAFEEAKQKRLPKTAIKALEPIIARALENQQHDEAVKAISMKVLMESEIQGGKPAAAIQHMRAEIAAAPEPIKPVMHAVLANWFWSYFQQNRWRFMQRTGIAAESGTENANDDRDFEAWDLPKILAAIDRQFDQALADAKRLQAIPVAQYDQLLNKGNLPDAYRPTLYDVLAFNAIDFYSAGEQAASKRQDAFEFSADSPAFDVADKFIQWQPQTTDDQSPTLKAIRLYQDILRLHLNDTDPSARLDANLSRLQFASSRAQGENKNGRYEVALRQFADQHSDHPVASRALHLLATRVDESGDKKRAHDIATEGLKLHPDSIGANRCFNLISTIELPSAHTTTERIWSDSGQTIDIDYRNLSRVYFRLIPFDLADVLRKNSWPVYQNNREFEKQLLARKPVKSWSAELPRTDDYQERTERLSVPTDVAPGSYVLVTSFKPDFGENDNQVSFSEVWKSSLALVTRSQPDQETSDGFLLDAKTGKPIAGAPIRVWYRRRTEFIEGKPLRTDRDGRFVINRRSEPLPSVMLATSGDQSVATPGPIYLYQRRQSNRPNQQTRFFTDRSLYRPGQTIRYKAISIAVDQNRDNYKVIGGQSVTVALFDANGKEVQRVEHQTNSYGSFSGSVTAPRDRLTGQMSLRVVDGPQGSTRFSVEEYKRPKFQVELSPPVESPKLDGAVKASGKATAYTGASINDAKVTWRVVRSVRYPDWWWWRCWWMPPSNPSQEIAHGTTTTAADGSFQIEFAAKPDRSVSRDSEPVFRFQVYADVTDTTGETRSDQSTVSVGYTALAASMAADRWLTPSQPVQLRIRTTTLGGNGQAAPGKLSVFALKQPDQVARPALSSRPRGWGRQEEPPVDPANPNSWPLGESVFEADFQTDASGRQTVPIELPVGIYRAKLKTSDRFGKSVTAELPLQVIDPAANRFALKLPAVLRSPQTTVQPGETFGALWASGYDDARAYIEVIHRGKRLQSYWTSTDSNQKWIEQKVTEAMRGGFTVRTTMVHDNRLHSKSQHVEVPWTNKKLSIEWQHFTSKLLPAAKETWKAVIRGPQIKAGKDAGPALAEMVATMYDASLDAYRPHFWQAGFGVFRTNYDAIANHFSNQTTRDRHVYRRWTANTRPSRISYRRLPDEIMGGWVTRSRGRRWFKGGVRPSMADGDFEAMEMMAVPASAAPADAFGTRQKIASRELQDESDRQADPDKPIDLSGVSVRKNLNETAFFLPHLTSNPDGSVAIEFTMPEALTKWKFMGFAHDQKLRAGLLTDTVVTSKDLMVQPNPPRFLRAGDQVEFTVKVSNQSATHQSGSVRLTFADARTLDNVDGQLGNENNDRRFDLAAGSSMSIAWRLSVPEGTGFLTYKAVGSTGRISDGEEGYLPVLSKRILVTESLPLPIRGKQTKNFQFKKLIDSAQSDSLKHHAVTMQMVSNPSWYAVLGLPYLMEYPHECNEQTFSRLYANALAAHIVGADPKIERIFDQWKMQPPSSDSTLDSPLEKNQDLKSVMIEETPWLRDAGDESQARRNVAVLFDKNRLADETARALFKLAQAQTAGGAWSWFPGGRPNDYITLYITTGFGRLRHLGVDVDMSPAIKSLGRMDAWATKRYQDIDLTKRNQNHLTTTLAMYLYGRSFFLGDQKIAAEHMVAHRYWIDQSKRYWTDLPRQSQAHLAIALKRMGQSDSAEAIIASLRERSVNDEELGMFWRDTEESWWWYRAPIETQAMMIEAFDEVADDQQAVEDCQVWLLKQKQTQHWPTTKATADAVYALLLRGTDLLASDALVEVTLGGQAIEPKKVEAGTGMFEQRFFGGQVTPELGKVAVEKSDDGVAWGSVTWQYLESIDKVTVHDGTPLNLSKKLFVKKNTKNGLQLFPVDGPVEVGDELVVRIELRCDRDMEYVHLKDHRGSGTEPVNVLSRYRYQDGLAYYESTRDTASHFFIDYLLKGTYVFEYSSRVQLRGKYETGLANIQCMYAPEFNSYSESIPIEVQ